MNYSAPPLPSRMLSLRLTMLEMDRDFCIYRSHFSTTDQNQNVFFIHDILIQFKNDFNNWRLSWSIKTNTKLSCFCQDKFKTINKSRQTCKKSRFVLSTKTGETQEPPSRRRTSSGRYTLRQYQLPYREPYNCIYGPCFRSIRTIWCQGSIPQRQAEDYYNSHADPALSRITSEDCLPAAPRQYGYLRIHRKGRISYCKAGEGCTDWSSQRSSGMSTLAPLWLRSGTSSQSTTKDFFIKVFLPDRRLMCAYMWTTFFSPPTLVRRRRNSTNIWSMFTRILMSSLAPTSSIQDYS